MVSKVFPDGPTERDLEDLKRGVRLYCEPGLFINSHEYVTFSAFRGQERSSSEDGEANKDTESHSTQEVEPLTEAELEDLEALEPLFSMETLLSVEQNLEATYKDNASREQLAKRFAQLRIRGDHRRFGELPHGWNCACDSLAARYPNFQSVIDLVRTEGQLAALSKPRALVLPPILLCGAPGIGKTAFAFDLAALLECDFFSLSMENSQHGAILCGTSRHWSTSKTGMVFDALTGSSQINPVFLVDELDKASTDSRNDPLAPLYQLLERKQAEVFRDESIPELPINASHILWIFTANDLKKIPAPICSRLQVIDIPLPTPDQARAIVLNVFEEAKIDIEKRIDEPGAVQLLGDMTLSGDAVAVLASMPTRQAKMRIRHAIAHALADGLTRVHLNGLINIDLNGAEVGPHGAH